MVLDKKMTDKAIQNHLKKAGQHFVSLHQDGFVTTSHEIDGKTITSFMTDRPEFTRAMQFTFTVLQGCGDMAPGVAEMVKMVLDRVTTVQASQCSPESSFPVSIQEMLALHDAYSMQCVPKEIWITIGECIAIKDERPEGASVHLYLA